MADDDYSPQHLEILRRMTPEQKLLAAECLYWTAREFKTAGFRMLHSEWTEAKVQEKVRHIFLHARS